MKSQLDNIYARQENSMATITNATIMAVTWHPCGIGPIKLFSSKIVDNYGP